LREPILHGGDEGCGHMVGNGKGKWIGLGWFRQQPTYEACLQYCSREDVGQQFCPCGGLFQGK
jgi:hypothetical protein